MDIWVLYAVRAFFVVAVITPPLLVIIYRWREVPLRRAEIEKMMKCAFDTSDKALCDKILAANPYISDPKQTFDRYHSPKRYILPLLGLTVLTASSAYIIYSSVRNQISLHAARVAANSAAAKAPAPAATPAPTESSKNSNPIPANWGPSFAIIMALAGGYIWSVYQICARSRSAELSPDDLYEIDLGLLAAVPVGIACSLVTAFGDVPAFTAFAASAFPLRDVSRMVRQYTTRQTLQASASDTPARPSELHLGTSIEGLSDQNMVRLGELRITTVLDMAYCDPIKVMVQTGFPLPVVIDWVDQSLWALYAGDLKSKINQRGIRCSLDICEFVDMHLRDKGKDGQAGPKKTALTAADQDALNALAKDMNDCNPVLLQDLLFRIEADPQVVVLRKLWYPTGVPEGL
jgi:hypothetical protein